MFESMLGLPDPNQQNKENEREERMLDKQLKASKNAETAALAADAHTDQTYNDFQERRADLIRWQQELDEEMFTLILTFLGLAKDSEGKIFRVLDEEGKPIKSMCNKLFIHQVVEPSLKPFLTKNLVNSHYEFLEILLTQKDTANDICNAMSDGWDKYGIEFTDNDTIMRSMKNIIRTSINRAKKGWTKKLDVSMIKRIEQERFGEEEQPQKRGLFSYVKT